MTLQWSAGPHAQSPPGGPAAPGHFDLWAATRQQLVQNQSFVLQAAQQARAQIVYPQPIVDSFNGAIQRWLSFAPYNRWVLELYCSWVADHNIYPWPTFTPVIALVANDVTRAFGPEERWKFTLALCHLHSQLFEAARTSDDAWNACWLGDFRRMTALQGFLPTPEQWEAAKPLLTGAVLPSQPPPAPFALASAGGSALPAAQPNSFPLVGPAMSLPFVDNMHQPFRNAPVVTSCTNCLVNNTKCGGGSQCFQCTAEHRRCYYPHESEIDGLFDLVKTYLPGPARDIIDAYYARRRQKALMPPPSMSAAQVKMSRSTSDPAGLSGRRKGQPGSTALASQGLSRSLGTSARLDSASRKSLDGGAAVGGHDVNYSPPQRFEELPQSSTTAPVASSSYGPSFHQAENLYTAKNGIQTGAIVPEALSRFCSSPVDALSAASSAGIDRTKQQLARPIPQLQTPQVKNDAAWVPTLSSSKQSAPFSGLAPTAALPQRPSSASSNDEPLMEKQKRAAAQQAAEREAAVAREQERARIMRAQTDFLIRLGEHLARTPANVEWVKLAAGLADLESSVQWIDSLRRNLDMLKQETDPDQMAFYRNSVNLSRQITAFTPGPPPITIWQRLQPFIKSAVKTPPAEEGPARVGKQPAAAQKPKKSLKPSAAAATIAAAPATTAGAAKALTVAVDPPSAVSTRSPAQQSHTLPVVEASQPPKAAPMLPPVEVAAPLSPTVPITTQPDFSVAVSPAPQAAPLPPPIASAPSSLPDVPITTQPVFDEVDEQQPVIAHHLPSASSPVMPFSGWSVQPAAASQGNASLPQPVAPASIFGAVDTERKRTAEEIQANRARIMERLAQLAELEEQDESMRTASSASPSVSTSVFANAIARASRRAVPRFCHALTSLSLAPSHGSEGLGITVKQEEMDISMESEEEVLHAVAPRMPRPQVHQPTLMTGEEHDSDAADDRSDTHLTTPDPASPKAKKAELMSVEEEQVVEEPSEPKRKKRRIEYTPSDEEE